MRWLIIGSCAWPLFAAADSEWYACTWQTEDGLPEHTIVALEQTSDGYLWLASHEGLFRFDGLRFQEFAPAMRTGEPSAQIRLMLRDRRGRLWLAKDGGTVLCVSQGVVAQMVQLAGEGFQGKPQSMAEDAEGAIWVSDGSGAIARIEHNEHRVFQSAAGLGHGLCRLATDDRGRLWFSQGGNTGLFLNGSFVTLCTLGHEAALLATALDGGIWLCSGLDLYRYHQGGKLQAVARLQLPSGRRVGEVAVLLEDQFHGLWIGAGSGGLLRYDGQTVRSVDSALPAITAITEDAQGDLWVSARGGGLNRYRPRAAEVLGLASGMPFVAVRSACEDAAGTLWAAEENGALARRRNGVWKLVTRDDGWDNHAVTCLASDADGRVLAGTRDAGVFLNRDGSFSALPLDHELPTPFIRSLYTCANGDLWIGANSGGTLHRCRDRRLKTFALPSGSGNVRTMAEDTHSNLWAATSDGRLLKVTGDLLADETPTLLPASHKGIRCLHFTRDGSLWIGFAGEGMGRLKNGRYVEFGSRQGLRDEYVSQILGDDQGRLWIGGNRGIFYVAQAELEAVAQGRASRVRSVVLGRGDGLPNLQAGFGVWPLGARCRDGRLLMPMLTGLAVIQPRVLRENPTPPPVVIERLRVNGQMAAAYDPPGQTEGVPGPAPLNLHAAPAVLRLGPGIRQMVFDFTALDLASPENVAFRYKLEGLHQDWVDAGATRFAPYTRLPPGHYRFRVTACGHDGIWNDAGASLAFTVQPYLWEVAWVRLGGGLTAVGLCGGGLLLAVRRRYRRKIERLEHRQVLERERTRIAQDLHDDLGAGLVEINFGSELAQDPALGIGEVREHTREIGARAKELVTALDEIVWAVNPKHDTVNSLATYFCQYAQHFLEPAPMRCHLDVAGDLPAAALSAERRHSLFLAFKEALCNAVQHSGATDLRLRIAVLEGALTVAVGDNGRGIAQTQAPTQCGADGLDNMRQRLQQLGGRCEVITRPGEGTTVTFTVPLAGSPAKLAHNSPEVL